MSTPTPAAVPPHPVPPSVRAERKANEMAKQALELLFEAAELRAQSCQMAREEQARRGGGRR